MVALYPVELQAGGLFLVEPRVVDLFREERRAVGHPVAVLVQEILVADLAVEHIQVEGREPEDIQEAGLEVAHAVALPEGDRVCPNHCQRARYDDASAI